MIPSKDPRTKQGLEPNHWTYFVVLQVMDQYHAAKNEKSLVYTKLFAVIRFVLNSLDA
ncbi:MAG: hypothetical protein RJB11_3233 [Planctomycetota bacterium]|jgi:hypothetical protein